MLFEKKKIQTETLSEYLSEVRNNLGFSPQEVCAKTGITFKFLQGLESGNFKVLPADVYVYGFLRQLASLYQVDPEDLILQYKKERGIEQHIAKHLQNSSRTWPRQRLPKVVITPKVLSLSLGAAFVFISLAYIIWQVGSINKTPSLKILEPADNAVIEASFVKVRGETDPGLSVTVNDQNIFVGADGEFETILSLTPGQKEIVVSSKNRFNKSVSKTLNITARLTKQEQNVTGLELKVDFTANVSVGVNIDNQGRQDFSFKSGETKTFFAKQQILLSTSDAGATQVSINGQSVGAIGRKGEALSNVVFSAPQK